MAGASFRCIVKSELNRSIRTKRNPVLLFLFVRRWGFAGPYHALHGRWWNTLFFAYRHRADCKPHLQILQNECAPKKVFRVWTNPAPVLILRVVHVHSPTRWKLCRFLLCVGNTYFFYPIPSVLYREEVRPSRL